MARGFKSLSIPKGRLFKFIVSLNTFNTERRTVAGIEG
jgi:hypothetical protein